MGDDAPRPGYAIDGGARDAVRLARQARVMSQASAAFLSRAGLGPGWSCLDLGCGGGQVTLHMARAAAPGGRAVGVDRDPEALALARAAAAEAGLAAEFVQGDASSPPAGPPADLAYARLLLSHLVDPMAVVRAMRDAVRPGGAVAVEDLETGTVHAEPANPAFADLRRIYSATVRVRGGDPMIGPRLPAMLAAAGLGVVEHRTVESPMRTPEERIFLAELVDNMRASILEAGVAAADEVDELRAALARAAREPDAVFYQARIHQVRAVRPKG